MVRLAFILLAAFLVFSNLTGKPHFKYSNNCEVAHQALLRFDLKACRKALSQERKKNPDNLFITYFNNYLDFFKAYAFENRNSYSRIIEKMGQRIDTIDDAPESKYKNLLQGEIYLHQSLVHLKFGDNVKAAWDLNRAYQFLESNKEQYPDFLLADRAYYALQAMVGSLPQSYYILANLAGMDGSLNEAINKYKASLKQMANNNKYRYFYRESKVLYAYLQLHLLGNETKALKIVKSVAKEAPNNPINEVFLSNIADQAKKNKLILETLSHYRESKPPIPYLDYKLGDALLKKHDPKAKFYFGRYIENFEGKSYVKDAYLKIGWSYLMAGQMDQYQNCMYLVKQKGGKQRSEDQQALQEVGQYDQNNAWLLKARLAFDGGYYDKALTYLNQDEAKVEPNTPLHAEMLYRKARIFQEQGRDDESLAYYDSLLVQKSQNLKSYWCPASYYYKGLILEHQGKVQAAEKQYKLCLDQDGYAYERSISRKAKAGLKRLDSE